MAPSSADSVGVRTQENGYGGGACGQRSTEDETGRPDFVLQTATGVTAVDFVGSATS
jgi:hypothetical protein